MLLLNKDWMEVLENRASVLYAADHKRLIWLQAWTAVQTGKACWLNRWHAVTWGDGGVGAYGGDDRFRDGRLLPRRSKADRQEGVSSQLDTEGIHSPQ